MLLLSAVLAVLGLSSPRSGGADYMVCILGHVLPAGGDNASSVCESDPVHIQNICCRGVADRAPWELIQIL